LYTLLARVKGDAVTASDVLDAWAAFDTQLFARTMTRWSRSKLLRRDTQAEDEPFAAAIRTAVIDTQPRSAGWWPVATALLATS
jgi:hypothetical protein